MYHRASNAAEADCALCSSISCYERFVVMSHLELMSMMSKGSHAGYTRLHWYYPIAPIMVPQPNSLHLAAFVSVAHLVRL